MRTFIFVIYFVLYLQTSGMDAQHPREHQAMKLYTRTLCKPRETLVKVEREFPEVTHTGVVPSCVPLLRCGGCCPDEAVECVSTNEHITVLQLKRFVKNAHEEMVESIIELPFVEHSQCECRLRDQQ